MTCPPSPAPFTGLQPPSPVVHGRADGECHFRGFSMLPRLSLLVLAFALLSLSAAEPPAKPWGPARWVWDNPRAAEEDQGHRAIYLRRTFELAAKPKTAAVHVTVDNRYELFVNGTKVGSD